MEINKIYNENCLDTMARRMVMIQFLMSIFKLHGILSSDTTMAQYKVALPLAVLFLA